MKSAEEIRVKPSPTGYRQFYCAVCGCPLIKKENKDIDFIVYPPEMLCEYHDEIVSIIMDGFVKINGHTNWIDRPNGTWKDFIQDNWDIMVEQFNNDFNDRVQNYLPPKDYGILEDKLNEEKGLIGMLKKFFK